MTKAADSRTYIMGYWPIPENPKNPIKHYFAYLPETLKMIAGCNLLFLCDNKDIITRMHEMTAQLDINLIVYNRTIGELQKLVRMPEIVEQTAIYGEIMHRPTSAEDFNGEKGLLHYWRDFKRCEPLTFAKMLAIWHSKIDIMTEVIEKNPFNTHEFAWIDASLSRFNETRPGWQFNKVQYSGLGKLFHYGSELKKNGKTLALNASFLLGDSNTINKLKELFNAQFEIDLQEPYPHDEETILTTVIANNPEMFELIHDKHVVVGAELEHQRAS